VSHRFQVVVPDPVAAQLFQLAETQGEPPSTIEAHMVRGAIGEAAGTGKVRSFRSAPSAVARAGGVRPRWLEPYGGDREWRLEMWGSIVALRVRYPRHLGSLKELWWTDESHTETLCALAVWRGDLDDGGLDPREEVSFQAQLAEYAAILSREAGGVDRAWMPGVPRNEWLAEFSG
jgi:hypothetical protein